MKRERRGEARDCSSPAEVRVTQLPSLVRLHRIARRLGSVQHADTERQRRFCRMIPRAGSMRVCPSLRTRPLYTGTTHAGDAVESEKRSSRTSCAGSGASNRPREGTASISPRRKGYLRGATCIWRTSLRWLRRRVNSEAVARRCGRRSIGRCRGSACRRGERKDNSLRRVPHSRWSHLLADRERHDVPERQARRQGSLRWSRQQNGPGAGGRLAVLQRHRPNSVCSWPRDPESGVSLVLVAPARNHTGVLVSESHDRGVLLEPGTGRSKQVGLVNSACAIPTSSGLGVAASLLLPALRRPQPSAPRPAKAAEPRTTWLSCAAVAIELRVPDAPALPHPETIASSATAANPPVVSERGTVRLSNYRQGI